MARIPKKLVKDAIVDAVCEIRFDCRENRESPEVVVGFLAKNPNWKSYTRKKLPAADIPEQIRIADPNFQNQATLELLEPNTTHIIRFGFSAVSTARRGEYPGWDTMADDIHSLAQHAFQSLEDFVVTRVGLRYINVLEPLHHRVNSIHDLRLNVSIDNEELLGGLNLNFIKHSENTKHTIRIASPEFIKNIRPAGGKGVVDIDSSTEHPELLTNADQIVQWAVKAHSEEKEIFFGLFEAETLESIVEKWA